MLTIALSHLLERGVRLETHEAVALARELLERPGGMPTPANIQLGSDGSASCISTKGTPSVASVAELLQTLLPAGTPNVPAALRYVIARGLEAVEAAPFASLSEFSSALKRFEKGSGREVLRGLLQRGARPSRPIAVGPPPVTPSAAPSAVTTKPTPVPPRPTLVARPPAASRSKPPAPAAAAPPMFRALGGEEAAPPVRASRRWALTVPAALVASFAVGFAVTDQITDRRAVTQSPRRAPGGSAPVTAAEDPSANRGAPDPRNAVVRVIRTPEVAREFVPSPEAIHADAPADALGGPAARVVEESGTIQAVHATQANAFSPAFASDGTAIFFHTSRERGARSSIEVAHAGSEAGRDAGIMTIVDDGSNNSHAQPSPDGRFVAFDSNRDGERGIYVAHRDGSQVRRVSAPGYAAVPTWSRNSEWLAYIRAEADKPSVWNLWVQPAAGGNARRVTNHRYGQTWAASWFPDNRRIAYSHEETLMVMDLQTGKATRYRTPVKGQLVRTPAVSPDGTQVIFQVFRHGAWVLDLRDGSMTRVLTDPTAEEFAWSPDGRRVAFHSRRDGRWGIYVLSRG